MHIYFSGIGGAGIGPLAEIALQAGWEVSGSDKTTSSYIDYLKKVGIKDIYINQSYEQIAKVHAEHPIDWLVYSSALPIEQPNAPEIRFAEENAIRHSKRNEFINHIIAERKLSLVAIAGTHGKTTTTALVVWLCSQHKIPLSYLLPAKTSFAPMGHCQNNSQFFVIEADEFDRNFLSFSPWLSVITGVSWDHHEIYPSRESYKQAFIDFIGQSEQTLIWQTDADYLGLDNTKFAVQDENKPQIDKILLKGRYNRYDGWMALQVMLRICDLPIEQLIASINLFPGLSRRMEEIIPGLYSDYAHTPEKIRAAMSVAKEIAQISGKNIVIVYEPLTNRRQHYMINDYKDCFDGANQVYWLPSYLAREDPSQRILPPSELITHLPDPTIATPALKNQNLKIIINDHLSRGDMVVAMSGGGGDSLDDWLRKNFYTAKTNNFL